MHTRKTRHDTPPFNATKREDTTMSERILLGQPSAPKLASRHLLRQRCAAAATRLAFQAGRCHRRSGIAPTGRYSTGASDNLGKGMWSYEVSGGATLYLDSQRSFSGRVPA